MLRSGCRYPRAPRYGRLQCSKNKAKCRAICRRGFQVRGSPVKTCKVETMKWNSSKPFVCERKISKSLADIINKRRLILNSSNQTNVTSLSGKDKENSLVQNLRSKIPTPKKASISAPKPSYTEILNIPTTKSESKVATTSKATENVASSASTMFFDEAENNTTPIPFINTATSHSTLGVDYNTQPTISSNAEEKAKSATKPVIAYPDTTNPQSKFIKLFNQQPRLIANQPTNPPEQLSTQTTTATNAQNGNTDSQLSAGNRGPINTPMLAFGAMVVGCPTYEGPVTIHSVWRDGFNGVAQFPPVEQPLLGGWMVSIIFSIPLNQLEVFTSDVFAVSQSRQEFVLVPKHYNRNLFQVL